MIADVLRYLMPYEIWCPSHWILSCCSLSDRAGCAESEEKAQTEYDKVYEGMKGVNEKMEAIAAKKKETGKSHGKIHKWVSFFAFSSASRSCLTVKKKKWGGGGVVSLYKKTLFGSGGVIKKLFGDCIIQAYITIVRCCVRYLPKKILISNSVILIIAELALRTTWL